MNTTSIPAGLIDPYLRTPVGRFALSAGSYTTRGAWAWGDTGWSMVVGASELTGEGSKWTRLSAPTPEKRVLGAQCSYYEILTGGSSTGQSSGTTISGITILAGTDKPAKALHLWSSGAVVDDVVVEDLWGDRKVVEGEGFGILINEAPFARSGGGSVVRGCVVNVAASSYACGIYLGTDSPWPLRRSLVDRCSVVCPSTPQSRGHCGYGINSRTTISRCESHGLTRAFFSDTGAGIDSCIYACFATGCAIGVELRSSREDWIRDRLTVLDTKFIMDGGPGDYVAGLVLADDSNGRNPRMSGIRFVNCEFVNASGKPGHVGSSNGPAFAPVEFEYCRWIGHWDRAQADAARWEFTGCKFRP